MNKISNFGSKENLLKNIISAEPMVYGAAPSNTGSSVVKFAFATRADLNGTTLATSNDNGKLVFNDLNGTGAIYVGDTLVSSKILDYTLDDVEVKDAENKILATDGAYYAASEFEAEGSVLVKAVNKAVSVKWVNTEHKITTTLFNAATAEALDAMIKSLNKSTDDRLDALETWAKDSTDFVSSTKDVVITATADETTGFQRYDASVNIDGVTIIRNALSGVLSAGKTLSIEEKDGHKYLTLTSADGDAIESEIDLCDFVGGSLISSTSYNKDTNELTLNFTTADGTAATPVVINIADVLDVNDVKIAIDSQDYLDYTIDGSTGVWHTKMVSLLDEDGNNIEGEVANGLVDASIVKTYIDQSNTDLAVSASGDSYIDASVDAKDNKHINIAAQTADVTVNTDYALGTWSVTDAGVATLADHVAPSIAGVAGKLLDSANAVTAIKSYVDAKVADEAAERAAKIEGAVKALDSSKGADGTNTHVYVEVTDGKLTDLTIGEDYATVTNVDYVKAVGTTELVNPEFSVDNNTALVIGSDLETLAKYVDDKVAQLKDETTSVVDDLDASISIAETVGNISFGFTQTDGLLDEDSQWINVKYATVSATEAVASFEADEDGDTGAPAFATPAFGFGDNEDDMLVKASDVVAAYETAYNSAKAYTEYSLTWEII